MRLTSLLRYATECIRNRPPPRPLPVIKSPPNAKVAVFGSSNLTDAILLDLQMSALLEEIRVFDVKAKAIRLSEDLNQIASTSVIRPYYGTYQIGCAVHGVDVIVLAGGHYGTPGEPMQEIFKKNLPSLLDMAYECAHHNPKAHVIVLTPPGTRNVPLISELYEKVGQKDDCQIMAPMYQHEMLVSKLVAENLRLAPNCVSMPVVGGCCLETVIPVFSCAAPQNEFSKGVIEDILYTIRHSNESVAVLQRGQPPAFAPAMATSKLILDIVRGSFGIEQPPHSVFMRSHVLMNVKYLGTPVSFGPGGVKKTNFMPQLSESEMKMLAKAVVQLQEDARIAEAAASAKWNELD